MDDSPLNYPCFTNNSFFDPFQVTSALANGNGSLFKLSTEIAIVQRKNIGIRVHIWKPKKRKPKTPFVRWKLHYHLVIRCRRRSSNIDHEGLLGPPGKINSVPFREAPSISQWLCCAWVATFSAWAYGILWAVLTKPKQPLLQLYEFNNDPLASFFDNLDPTQSFWLSREFILERPFLSFQDLLAALVLRH